MSEEQAPKRRGRPPGSTNQKVHNLTILHEGSLWEFAPGTRIRRVLLAGRKWLIVVPATSAPPFLLDPDNRKRSVTEADVDVMRRLVAADVNFSDELG